MRDWKRVALISASAGGGFAVVFSLVLTAFVWYKQQAESPTPWNRTAIVAKFDSVATVGKTNTLAFYYRLQNTTDNDYKVRLVINHNVVIMAKTRSWHVSRDAIRSRDGREILPVEESESLVPTSDWLDTDDSVFIPAGQTVRIAIRLRHTYLEWLSMNPTPDEQRAYQEKLAAYVADQFSTLDGFVVFDEVNRYQIDLPRGW